MVKFRTLYKVLQRKCYDILSLQYALLLIVITLIFFVITLIHFGEAWLGWNKNKCEVYYRSFSDNIAGKPFNDELCHRIPIDVVYTWVNGSDPVFLKDLQELTNNTKYAAIVNETFSSRFEDLEELRYSLRSLEMYAPWVHHVFLVTNGQIPYWLDMGNPRLTIVTHKEIFLNHSHLPTFSSPAIESHLHRIPGLSKYFIYLNDDIILGKPIWPEDFLTESEGYKIFITWNLPECSSTCTWSWVGDGSCDPPCNVEECSFDGGDCNSTKNSDLKYNSNSHNGPLYQSSLDAEAEEDIRLAEEHYRNIQKTLNSNRTAKEDNHTILSMNLKRKLLGSELVKTKAQDWPLLYKRNTPARLSIQNLYKKGMLEYNARHKILGAYRENEGYMNVSDVVRNSNRVWMQHDKEFRKMQKNLRRGKEKPRKLLKDYNLDRHNITYISEQKGEVLQFTKKPEVGPVNRILKALKFSACDWAREIGDETWSLRMKVHGNGLLCEVLQVPQMKMLPYFITNGTDLTLDYNFLVFVDHFPNNVSFSTSKSAVDGLYAKRTLDMFAESLLHVNRLYNKEFGVSQRKVIAHMPHFINKDIITELQNRFPQEWNNTSSHKLRSRNDMQYAFSYFYFIVNEKTIRTIPDIFDDIDTDGSGTWSDREVRTLLTRIYGVPLNYAVVLEFEDYVINCSKVYGTRGAEVPTPLYERYSDSKLPTITKSLIENCPAIIEMLNEHFAVVPKYKYELIKEADQDAIFKMITSNLTKVIEGLDVIRSRPRKFICLNNNLDASKKSQKENDFVRAVVHDFYQSLYPKKSSFELNSQYRNRFIYIESLRQWQDFTGARCYLRVTYENPGTNEYIYMNDTAESGIKSYGKDRKFESDRLKAFRRMVKISLLRTLSGKDERHWKRAFGDGAHSGVDALNYLKYKMKDKAEVTDKEDSWKNYEDAPKWNHLPQELLLKIFQFLSAEYLMKVSQVCKVWNSVGQDPTLWSNFEVVLGSGNNSTPQSLIDFILRNHKHHLKRVIFKADSSGDGAEKVCHILRKLVHCSLRTLAFISCATPVFLDVDPETFTSALTVVFNHTDAIRNLAADFTPIDDPSLRTLAKKHSRSLQLLKVKSCPRISPEGVLVLADNCLRLRELSLNYTVLSDDILKSLSSEQHVKLINLRIDVCTDHTTKLRNKISTPSWQALVNHSPNINLIMYFFVVDVESYDLFFHSYNPVSHVYFCEYVPKNVLRRISKNCPRIKELVVNGTDGPTIDFELIDLGLNCDRLTSIGLSDCYITCSAFVEFVRISCKRLSELFISEDCLVQSFEYDLQKVILRVSELLSTDWEPEFIPLW